MALMLYEKLLCVGFWLSRIGPDDTRTFPQDFTTITLPDVATIAFSTPRKQ